MSSDIATHPVQVNRRRGDGRAPVVVTMRAYEVYCKVFAPQQALIEGSCRGGFGVGELIGFLYARSFPQEEWTRRFDEAMAGLSVD